MPRERNLLEKYNISSFRYRELINFCKQYPEKKRKVNDSYYLSAVSTTGVPGSGARTSSVERRAESNISEKNDVELIERCISLACAGESGLCDCLLKNVTLGISPEHMPVPCGRRQFFEKRKKFFIILNREKG